MVRKMEYSADECVLSNANWTRYTIQTGTCSNKQCDDCILAWIGLGDVCIGVI